MMLLALAIALIQPGSFLKERSAENMLANSGRTFIAAEHLSYLEAIDCTQMTDAVSPNQPDFPGLHGSGQATVIRCSLRSPCGNQIDIVVWHEPVVGPYLVPDPMSDYVASACFEMMDSSQ